MRIRLAVIKPEDLAGVMRLAGDLRSAVSAGNMDGVDAATNKLMVATTRTRSVDITEDEWRGFIKRVRANSEALKSDYVIPGQLCLHFFPDATSETLVLQIPIDLHEVDNV